MAESSNPNQIERQNMTIEIKIRTDHHQLEHNINALKAICINVDGHPIFYLC